MDNYEYKNKAITTDMKRLIPFIGGLGFCLVAMIVFFIGAFGTATNSLWITAAVFGGIAAIMLAVSAYTTDGWIRAFSIILMAATVVVLTYMATVTWAF